MNQEQQDETADIPPDVMDSCRVGDHVDLRIDEGTEGTKMVVVAVHEHDIGLVGEGCKVYPSFDVYKAVRPGIHRRVTLMEFIPDGVPEQDGDADTSDESL